MLGVWYCFLGSNPHLLAPFIGKSDGKPFSNYLAVVPPAQRPSLGAKRMDPIAPKARGFRHTVH